MSKKRTPLWREARFEVKMYKTPQRRTTFGSCDVEKVHAVAARSTFPSQNVQNTSKHLSVGPLLEVAMSKKCTPLWREAHFQVKMHKTHQNTSASDHFWKLRCRKSARRCGAKHISKSKCSKTHYFRTTFGGSDVASLRFTTIHYSTLHYITQHYTPQHYRYNYTTTLHYTKLDYTTVHYTTLHCTTFHYTSLHYTSQHSTTLQLQLHNYTPLH